jgi:hypothetical protein
MPTSPDYRQYLEQRFADLTTLMNARFNTVDADNEQINSHLRELNGTVKDHTKQIVDLKVSDELHITECPAIPELKTMKENLQEYDFVKKHPNLALIIIAVFVVGMIISAIGTVKTITNGTASKEIKQGVREIQYDLAPLRSAQPTPLDPDEVIKKMKKY